MGWGELQGPTTREAATARLLAALDAYLAQPTTGNREALAAARRHAALDIT